MPKYQINCVNKCCGYSKKQEKAKKKINKDYMFQLGMKICVCYFIVVHC